MPRSPSPFSLAGRSVLVTGGTQGVGAAICRAIAEAGGRLVIHGLRDDSAARETLEHCRSAGARAELLCMDLLPNPWHAPAGPLAAALFQRAIETDPAIDCLVNNAGVYLDGPFDELSSEIFYRTLQVNVAAGLFLTKAFVDHRSAAGQGGRILFTGSINGLLSEPEHVSYDASKGAVAAMVRSLCADLAPRGFRVNAMAPGLVVTPLTGVLESNAPLRQWMELHTPVGRVPTADVCGPPAVFLLSDAAEHIHGQTLYVDGGMSAWQQPNPPSPS